MSFNAFRPCNESYRHDAFSFGNLTNKLYTELEHARRNHHRSGCYLLGLQALLGFHLPKNSQQYFGQESPRLCIVVLPDSYQAYLAVSASLAEFDALDIVGKCDMPCLGNAPPQVATLPVDIAGVSLGWLHQP